jgi:hypothetical protein
LQTKTVIYSNRHRILLESSCLSLGSLDNALQKNESIIIRIPIPCCIFRDSHNITTP